MKCKANVDLTYLNGLWPLAENTMLDTTDQILNLSSTNFGLQMHERTFTAECISRRVHPGGCSLPVTIHHLHGFIEGHSEP